MNNIVANFSQILAFAKDYGLPEVKKRAILREYLQVKILAEIYKEKNSFKLSFTGGSSLRLLRNLNRFSEDLDFDNLGLENSKVDYLIEKTSQALKKENLKLTLYKNTKGDKHYFEFRFKNLLWELQISKHDEEKLMIKFDYSNLWQKQKTQIALLNRYGFIFNLTTNNLNQILVQKLAAYVGRRQTQPRDIYDVVWLKAQGARIDFDFLKANNLPKNLGQKAAEKFAQEKNKLAGFKRKLQPFLVNEENIIKLDLFPQVLKNIYNP